MKTIMAVIFGANARKEARMTVFMYVMIAECTAWQQWLSSAPDVLSGISWKSWCILALTTLTTGLVTARAVMNQSWTPNPATDPGKDIPQNDSPK